jgi:hypothetical protein|tara:strand:- start:145 stop:354 length:210 start_codon:yes stop_codon:yes gene_type:complete
MKAKQNSARKKHGHLRGSVAANTELMFDLDFVDEMTGNKPLTRSEVARLRAHMRQMVSVFFFGLICSVR